MRVPKIHIQDWGKKEVASPCPVTPRVSNITTDESLVTCLGCLTRIEQRALRKHLDSLSPGAKFAHDFIFSHEDIRLLLNLDEHGDREGDEDGIYWQRECFDIRTGPLPLRECESYRESERWFNHAPPGEMELGCELYRARDSSESIRALLLRVICYKSNCREVRDVFKLPWRFFHDAQTYADEFLRKKGLGTPGHGNQVHVLPGFNEYMSFLELIHAHVTESWILDMVLNKFVRTFLYEHWIICYLGFKKKENAQ